MTHDEATEYSTVIRGMIKHENELANQRLTWMFTLQGLLFAAASYLWKDCILPVMVFGFVGIISCISIGYFLYRGHKAIKNLLEIGSGYKKFLKSLPPGTVFPPLIGIEDKTIDWLLPTLLLPSVLGIAWIAILIFRIIIYFLNY